MVTITEGISKYATQKPLNAEHKALENIPVRTDIIIGNLRLQHIPVIIEAKIIFDATDISMSPNIKIKTIPRTRGHTSIPDCIID
jgi:hypothetical protein